MSNDDPSSYDIIPLNFSSEQDAAEEAPIQRSFFEEQSANPPAPPPPPPSDTQPPRAPDHIEYREITLGQIDEHRHVHLVLRALEIFALWTLPENYVTADGIRELAAESPLHVVRQNGEYQCFCGFVLLRSAKRTLPLTDNVPAIVHTSVDLEKIFRAVFVETVLRPIWYRHSSGEAKRLTEIAGRLQHNPQVGSLIRAKTKAAWARLMKRSVSALRRKKS